MSRSWSFVARLVARPFAREHRVVRYRQPAAVRALFSPSMSISVEKFTGGTALGVWRGVRAGAATTSLEHAPQSAEEPTRATLAMVVCVGVRGSVWRLERALAHTRHEARATTARHPRPTGVFQGFVSVAVAMVTGPDKTSQTAGESCRFEPVARACVLLNLTKVYFHQRQAPRLNHTIHGPLSEYRNFAYALFIEQNSKVQLKR